MRQIHDHVANPVNDILTITVVDEPGAGGANHLYVVTGMSGYNPSADIPGYSTELTRQSILFQNGPIADVGVNGVTQEVLLAIVIDRLRSFQAGPFFCRENAIALTKCEEALLWLKSRTYERMNRGVEGRMEK